MKDSTRRSKEAAKQFIELSKVCPGLVDMMAIQELGKSALDDMIHTIGGMVVESLLQMEREQVTGASHRPKQEKYYKWGYQGGSVYLGDQKRKIKKPRAILDGEEYESPLYAKLNERGQFSEELLMKIMAGMSARQYRSTVEQGAEAFGVSPSSVSQHFIEASAEKMKEFLERDLSHISLFSVLLDTVHRGGMAFIVALGIDQNGNKEALGYWEGATENSTITKQLFDDLERRKLKLTDEALYITDGGSGVIKALRDRFGERLMHQRCTIHKGRNIQQHLPKKYRDEAYKKYTTALKHVKYEDAREALMELEAWLRAINPSAANSLLEGVEELLTLHKLQVDQELRKVLSTTNGIENVFSTTRHLEKNVKNYSRIYNKKSVKKEMSQRWLATVLLTAESRFRRVKGHQKIPEVIANIKRYHQERFDNQKQKAA